MNLEQRIRLLIGDLIVQLQMAQARIEELEAELKEARRVGPLHEVK